MTGDDAVDQISRAGLLGLTRVLERRTSVEAGMPLGISLERDDMAFFPLVYWPVTPTQPEPSQEAVDQVNYFLSHGGPIRSEEHTSELQSLMRISYAVLCLKKKINQK